MFPWKLSASSTSLPVFWGIYAPIFDSSTSLFGGNAFIYENDKIQAPCDNSIYNEIQCSKALRFKCPTLSTNQMLPQLLCS